MDENDWDGWKALTERLGGKVQLVGVTRERIRQIEAKALRKLRHPSRSKQLKIYRTNPTQNNLLF